MRRRRSDPKRLGNLTFWEGVDEDGDKQLLWAAITTDPDMTDALDKVKQVFRECGWAKTAGD
jgi:hypothetical protein